MRRNDAKEKLIHSHAEQSQRQDEGVRGTNRGERVWKKELEGDRVEKCLSPAKVRGKSVGSNSHSLDSSRDIGLSI